MPVGKTPYLQKNKDKNYVRVLTRNHTVKKEQNKILRNVERRKTTNLKFCIQ